VEQALAAVRILSVRVQGPLGVLGATVTLTTADGRVLGRRDLGSNIATGCSGPATVALAVREPATQLNVRWSDGLVRRWPVTLGADAPRMQVLTAERNGGQAP